MREELFTIFWEPMRINSVSSGLSFNLFVNMKFESRLGSSLVFVLREKFAGESVMYYWVSSA